MKTQMEAAMKRLIYVLLGISIISFSMGIAQTREPIEEKDINQLIYGLHSNVDGIRESSVYLAGKYNINIVSEEIKDILLNDPSGDVRKMAVHVLYLLEGKKALNTLHMAAESDSDTAVKFLCSEYYHMLTGEKVVIKVKK